MKTKLIIAFFTIVLCCRTKATQNEFDYDKEVHNLINQIVEQLEGNGWFEDGSPSINYILDKGFSKTLDYEDVNDLYSKGIIKETKFADIETQMSHFENFKLEKEYIHSKSIISHDTIQKMIYQDKKRFWEQYESYYGKSGFYEFSYPIFSIDKKNVLLKVSKTLFGMEGTYAWYLCSKQDKGWLLEDVILEGY